MRRVGWGIADQALSSASNVLFVLALARLLDPTRFGLYVLVYTALAAALGITRGALGTMITIAAPDDEQVRTEARRGAGAALCVGSVLGLALGAGLMVSGSPVHPAMGLALPVLLVQDVFRVSALALGRVMVAVCADGLWCAVSLALLAATWLQLPLTPPAAVQVWVATGALSAMAIAIALGIRPTRSFSALWSAPTAGDRARFAGEASVAAASSLALTIGVTGFVGPVANAALRGAGTVVGPVNVLLSSLQVALVPELRRRGARSFGQLTRLISPVTAVIALTAISISAVGAFLPERVGKLALGESWSVVAPVLVVLGAEYVGQAVLANATTILRTRAESAALLRVRLVLSALQILAGLSAAAAFGSAVAVAIASALVVGAVALWANLRAARTLRDLDPVPMNAA